MVSFTAAKNEKDLKGILALQSANLIQNLSEVQRKEFGFLTISHSLELLTRMNEASPNILAKAGDNIAGFCLSMTQDFENEIAILIPMFQTFNSLEFMGRKIKDINYITVGQVCVSDGFRNQGVFDGLYSTFRRQFENDYEIAVTEIALRNTRSLAAHQRVGFVPLHQYAAPDGEIWQIVVWNWRK